MVLEHTFNTLNIWKIFKKLQQPTKYSLECIITYVHMVADIPRIKLIRRFYISVSRFGYRRLLIRTRASIRDTYCGLRFISNFILYLI